MLQFLGVLEQELVDTRPDSGNPELLLMYGYPG
jgi:hypothetical protein